MKIDTTLNTLVKTIYCWKDSQVSRNPPLSALVVESPRECQADHRSWVTFSPCAAPGV